MSETVSGDRRAPRVSRAPKALAGARAVNGVTRWFPRIGGAWVCHDSVPPDGFETAVEALVMARALRSSARAAKEITDATHHRTD